MKHASRPPKADKRQYVRCPMCQRQPVLLKRGRMVSHLNPGGVKCHAAGFRIEGTQFDKRVKR